MFTVEIDGRAIAVTNAQEDQARDLIESEEFLDDLMVMESNGKPVWNGQTPVTLRPATPDEKAEFHEADDLDDDDMDDEDEPCVVFLIDIDDEEDED